MVGEAKSTVESFTEYQLVSPYGESRRRYYTESHSCNISADDYPSDHTSDSQTVLTPNGLIKGTKEHTVNKGDIYYAYRGIPYAKPPIGNLRFELPQPFGKWSRTLDATKEKDVCPQVYSTTVNVPIVIGNENCLYLNVYTPLSSIDADRRKHLAVMVWIHGGGYFEGNNQYDLYAPDFFLEENVVVVTIAYRLGIFGFLSTGDLIAPGNNGLKDQILALKWVNDNVRAFGGDPKRLTIFGESAGGASVAFLTQTPLTRGLYQRAIMQSGSSHNPWAVSQRSLEVAHATAKFLNINATSNRDLKDKLKRVDYKRLLAMATYAQNRLYGGDPISSGLPLGPVIEPKDRGAVITRPVYQTLISGDFNLTPMLIGINSLESVGFIVNELTTNYLNTVKLASSKLVPGDFNIKHRAILKKVGDQIKSYYFDSVDATKFNDEQLYAYFSDCYFATNIMEAAEISSKFTDVFFYVLSHLGDLGNPQRPSNLGVGHTEDLNYLFYRHVSPLALTTSDRETRTRMVKMWTNFAKTSNPTPQADSVLQNVVWKEIDKNFNYLDIGDDLIPGINPHHEDYQFWKRLYAQYRTT